MMYYLIKKHGVERDFTIMKDYPSPPEKLKQVEYFTKVIESKDIEIFDIIGVQFVTSEGVFLIASEDELTIQIHENTI